MSKKLEKLSRAKDCRDGSAKWTCLDCATEYRKIEIEVDVFYTATHFGTCYICHQTKAIGKSRQLFGHNKD